MVPSTSNSAVRSFSGAESKVTRSAEAEMVIGLPASSVPASTSIACNSFTLLLLSLGTTKSAPCGPKLGSTTGGVDPAVETLKNRDSCGWLLKAVQQQG